MKFYSTCCSVEYIAHTDYIGMPDSILIKSYEAGQFRHCWAECSNCGKSCNLSVTKNKIIRWIKINLLNF